MENIILTNNKDLRLVSVKVGVLSTLRFELPLVSASATHVEVIVTSGDVHSAYTATFIDATKRWQCDIAASQFPTVGKQSYEVAYVLDGKQFWDGKGWIEIEDATTSGIEPQPRPEPYRYVVVSVNGYGADAQGAVRIPKTFIATDSPVTTEGYMEGDIYFNRETGATWTLCNVQSTLTWVFNYKNYYTKQETDEAIDRVAAYYITYDAAGNPFPTYAALANATTVYSGGRARVPTRNDYCVVLSDETHGNSEYRYIYAVAEGQTTGSWQPQFPVGGIMTIDSSVTKNSSNPVTSSGIWATVWGALTEAIPTGFTSLYDWCVSQLAGKAADNAVVHLTGDQQTMSAVLQLMNTLYAESGVESHGDYRLTWTVGGDYAGTLTISQDTISVQLAGENEPRHYRLQAGGGGTVALLENIAPAFVLSQPYGAGELCTSFDADPYHYGTWLYKCIVATDGSTPPELDSTHWTPATVEDVLAALRSAIAGKAPLASPAFTGTPTAPTPTTGDNSTKVATTAFVQGAVPYALGTPIVINTASSETVEGETVYYGAATLADHTANIVQVTAATALDELRITFPAATSGKVRDFGLRVEIGTGSAALAAPALVPIAPTGETIKIENNAAEIPALADGTATAKGVTLLYFSENAPGVFVVKGEQVEEVA